MLQRLQQGLASSSTNAWLHQLPPQHLARVVIAAQRSAASTSSSSSSSRPTEGSSRPSYPKKQRLDDYCLQQYPQYSKNLVQSWIAQGKVLVNDKASSHSATGLLSTTRQTSQQQQQHSQPDNLLVPLPPCSIPHRS
jgi:23S rRNA-/tRNA-specific pseudouridylate synthase